MVTAMTFDSHAYEREQMVRQQEASKTIREMAAWREQVDEYGRGLVVLLLCPKGHGLIRIMVSDPPRDSLVVTPVVDQPVRAAGAVTRRAEPWIHVKGTCVEPGCPNPVDRIGRCADHGGRALEEIGGVRTEFRCRQCRRVVGEVTTARLLQLYGLALKLGLDSIPIADTPERRA